MIPLNCEMAQIISSFSRKQLYVYYGMAYEGTSKMHHEIVAEIQYAIKLAKRKFLDSAHVSLSQLPKYKVLKWSFKERSFGACVIDVAMR